MSRYPYALFMPSIEAVVQWFFDNPDEHKVRVRKIPNGFIGYHLFVN